MLGKLARFAGVGAFIVAVAAAIIAAVALWVQFLFNGLAADVFGAPELGYWKAVLLVLSISTLRTMIISSVSIKH